MYASKIFRYFAFLALILASQACKKVEPASSIQSSLAGSGTLDAKANHSVSPNGFGYAMEFDSIKDNCVEYETPDLDDHSPSRLSTTSNIQIKESLKELKKELKFNLTAAISAKIFGAKKLSPTASFMSKLDASASSLYIYVDYEIENTPTTMKPIGLESTVAAAVQRSAIQKWFSDQPKERLHGIWITLGGASSSNVDETSPHQVTKLFNQMMGNFNEIQLFEAFLRDTSLRSTNMAETAMRNVLKYSEKDRQEYIKDLLSVFYYSCGDRYLSSYKTGAKLTSIIQVHGLTKDKQKQLGGALNSEIRGVAINTGLDKLKSTGINKLRKTIWYDQIGGTPASSDPLFNIDEIIQRIELLNCIYSQEEENKCDTYKGQYPIISFETSSYSTLPSNSGLLSQVIRHHFAEIYQENNEALRGLSDAVMKNRSIISAANKHVRSVTSVDTRALLFAAHNQLDAAEGMIVDCFYDYASCRKYHEAFLVGHPDPPKAEDIILKSYIDTAHRIQNEVGINLEDVGLDDVPNCLTQLDPLQIKKREKLNLCAIDMCFIYDLGLTDRFKETIWLSNILEYAGSKSEWAAIPATYSECGRE